VLEGGRETQRQRETEPFRNTERERDKYRKRKRQSEISNLQILTNVTWDRLRNTSMNFVVSEVHGKHVLARMRGKRNPLTLLVGV
jgi:hypothetical protein